MILLSHAVGLVTSLLLVSAVGHRALYKVKAAVFKLETELVCRHLDGTRELERLVDWAKVSTSEKELKHLQKVRRDD
jgi:hypothetical protein